MLISEGSALVSDTQDRPMELYVRRTRRGRDRAHALQVEIDKATPQREQIRR
jgi:hypothetical protein